MRAVAISHATLGGNAGPFPIFGINAILDYNDCYRHGRGRKLFDGPRCHKGIKAARSQYEAWLDIVTRANWRTPEDIKASYPKAGILKSSRVVFNIKGNDYRLVAAVQCSAGVLAIRFFGTHAEY
jgi:mRNA interferase HigB